MKLMFLIYKLWTADMEKIAELSRSLQSMSPVTGSSGGKWITV